MSNIYLNEGVKEPLSEIFKEIKVKRLVLVKGKNSYPNGLLKANLEKFEASNILELSDFTPNPKFEEVCAALQKIQHFKPDVFLGVGGGSILDIAKLLRFMFRLSKTEEEFRNTLSTSRIEGVLSENKPLILLPTTAGSGAEATQFAVVYIGQKKYSFLHPELMADFVIADKQLIRDAPNRVLAGSIMDGLAQSIESLWSRGCTTESQKFSEKAMKDLWAHGVAAVLRRPDESLEKIIVGSNLAGKAINITKTTGNHALSYKITTDYGIPHGHCVGMLLPTFFKLHDRISTYDKSRGEKINAKHKEIFNNLSCCDLENFLKDYYNRMSEMGLMSFESLNSQLVFDKVGIVDSINTQRLVNHPIELDIKELESIFEQ